MCRLLLTHLLLAGFLQLVYTACTPSTGSCPPPNDHTCLLDQYSRNDPCTSNDVPITNVFACDATGTTCNANVQRECVADEPFEFSLSYQLQSNAQNRYDFGLFLASDGQSAFSGSCCRYKLENLNGCTGQNRFENLDGDACFDIKKGLIYKQVITTTVKCVADADGKLQLNYCSVWDQNTGTTCSSVDNLKPGAPSKCRCDKISVGNVNVVGAELAAAFVATSPVCYVAGTNLVQYFTVTNPKEFPLINIGITSSLGSTIRCCTGSVACATYTLVPGTIPLAAHTAIYCQATYAVPSATHVTLTNVISVSGTDPRPNALNPITTTATSTIEEARISVSQTVSGTTTGSWTLTITNTGAVALTGGTISGTATTIYNGCTIPSLPAGGSATCTGTTIPTGQKCTDTFAVTVAATADVVGACPVSGSDSDTIDYTRVCRSSTAPCDPAESCTAGQCPADVTSNALCTTCTCAPGTCDPTNTNAWSVDGCVHKFGGTGTTLPPSNQGLANCGTPPTK